MRSKKVQQEHIRVNFSFIEYINTLNSCISLDMRGAGRLVAVFLSLVLFTSSLSMVFAQTDLSQIPPLSVSTNLPLYDEGDTVTFSGFIKSRVCIKDLFHVILKQAYIFDSLSPSHDHPVPIGRGTNNVSRHFFFLMRSGGSDD